MMRKRVHTRQRKRSCWGGVKENAKDYMRKGGEGKKSKLGLPGNMQRQRLCENECCLE